MKYLGTSEAVIAAVALAVLPAYWMSAGAEVAWSVRLPPLLLVCYILVQGALYWALKYRQYARGVALPLWLAGLFRFFRLSNVIALAVAAVALVFTFQRGAAATDLAWGAGLWAFAMLEHINYYHWQLMYDTRGALRRLRQTRRLRRPMLAEDILSAGKIDQVSAQQA
ncbi:hypothetical protein [Lysobacter sp. A3-1-A15]|uniref:hypothetical protein n=1 Tax=Novilysobacter viscosus TaxID=3098602 RepID=UPI002ED9B886